MQKVIAMQLSPHIGTTRRKTTGETCQIRLMVQQRKKKNNWVGASVGAVSVCIVGLHFFNLVFFDIETTALKVVVESK